MEPADDDLSPTTFICALCNAQYVNQNLQMGRETLGNHVTAKHAVNAPIFSGKRCDKVLRGKSCPNLLVVAEKPPVDPETGEPGRFYKCYNCDPR